MPVYTLPNTVTGGSQTVNASSLADAQNQAAAQGTWSPSAGTYGANSLPDGGGGGGGASGDTAANVTAAQMLLSAANNAATAAYQQGMLQYQNDQLAFQKATEAFNQTIQQANLTGTYQGQPTQAAQLQAANIAAQVAQLTGYYNAPGTSAGGVPQGLTWDQLSQSMRARAGASYNDAAKNLAFQLAGQQSGSVPLNLSTDQLNQIVALGTGGQYSDITSFYGGQGTPTLAAQNQYATLFGTGMPGTSTAGQQTLAAQQQQQQAAQQYLTLLSQLQGPQDYGKYLQVLGSTPQGLQSLVGAAAGKYIPGGGATTGQTPTASNLQSFVGAAATGQVGGQLGGATSAQPGTDYASYLQAAQSLPSPNQISPQSWNAMTDSQKQMLLGMYGQLGYTSNDVQDLFAQSLPKYAAGGGQAGAFQLQ